MTSNILDEIIDWIVDKPLFWQEAIKRIIEKGELNDNDILAISNVAKHSFGLIDLELVTIDLNQLRNLTTDINSQENIVLKRIYNTNNINALKDNSTLPFESTGINIIYGDNGAGKSSYTSILKNVCHTRGRKPIINNNIYKEGSSNIPKIAYVEYESGNGQSHNIVFENGDVKGSGLKAINVFDSMSADHYIDDSDEVAIIPYGILVLERLSTSVKMTEKLLKDEIQANENILSKNCNLSSLALNEDTKAYHFTNTINSASDLQLLDELTIFNKEENDKIEKLKLDIDNLKKIDPFDVIKRNNEKINRFRSLKAKLENISKFSSQYYIKEIEIAISDFILKRDTLKIVSEKLFEKLPIEGIGNDSWRQLWESARNFINESQNTQVFPDISENGVCPLCLQTLDDNSRQRFSDFENYIKNDAQAKYDKSFNCILELQHSIEKISLDLSDLEIIVTEVEGINSKYKSVHDSYILKLSNYRDEIKQIIINKEGLLRILSIEENPISFIQEIIGNLESDNQKQQSRSIKDELSFLNKNLNELSDVKVLFENKKKIIDHIGYLSQIGKLKKCVDKCATNAITSFSNALAGKYIATMLQNSFEEELTKLGFINMRIASISKGSLGKQIHALNLMEEHRGKSKLKDILSEGERRSIALATFFSELSLSEYKNPIVFDDPVSSLDHKWRSRIAKRIAEEAQYRQVIVFTHDIVFMHMLNEYSDVVSVCVQGLTRKPKETGIVLGIPWTAQSTRDRLKTLANWIEKLKEADENGTKEEYEEMASRFYGLLRETWERFIEEVVLNQVVQRFDRRVQTQRLVKVLDLTEIDYKKIDENMSKCSKFLDGHDNALRLGEPIPSPIEINTDIKTLHDYWKEINKRREKK